MLRYSSNLKQVARKLRATMTGSERRYGLVCVESNLRVSNFTGRNPLEIML
jgi:hypothetical protein